VSGWGSGARWLTAVSIAAVLGVNAAGLWGIAVARRSAQEEAVRLFRVDTGNRARIIERALLQTRADLAFLAGSSAVSRLEGLGRPGERWEDEWRQLAAEAVVVFLRAHPEIAHLTVKSGKGYALVRTARRGGLPVLWSASDELAASGAGPHAERHPDDKHVVAEFAFAGSGPDVVRLMAEVDATPLVAQALAANGQVRRCVLRDAAGQSLAEGGASAVAGGSDAVSADALVRADGWSKPSPWTLTCASGAAPDTALAPVTRSYRLTLALNLGAMMLAVLLGSFAIQQTRRRERLEAQARDERRIRELERQLFHAERLGTVGRLAAGMAHEINNPLEGMSNYLSLARDELARGQTDRLGRRLDGVREGMERIAGIVRQVLAQADPATAPATPVDVTALVQQTADFVRTRRELERIAVTVDVPAAPLVVQGNAVTLGQVLLNIALNACEAQPEGGELRMSARAEDGRVLLEVADRGGGIAADDLPRIFEPFYSTKQSTGLGLAICHTIVAQHRGELTARNREGGGAVFRIHLPTA
jgi:signal transduction histidine kinase